MTKRHAFMELLLIRFATALFPCGLKVRMKRIGIAAARVFRFSVGDLSDCAVRNPGLLGDFRPLLRAGIAQAMNDKFNPR